MYKLIFLISFLITGNMDGQTINSNITGEYYLQGVMETASGFQINPDSTFQFFFSQGALDRTGKGKWEEKDGYLILNSKDKPALDFALLNSKKIENDSFTVRVIEPNQALLRYVDVYFKVDGKGKHGTTDSDGLVSFPGKAPEELIIMFQFCPEKHSLFKLENKDHNYYEFRFKPWVFDIFLDNFKLKYNGNVLIGGNPVMEGGEFKYVKN